MTTFFQRSQVFICGAVPMADAGICHWSCHPRYHTWQFYLILIFLCKTENFISCSHPCFSCAVHSFPIITARLSCLLNRSALWTNGFSVVNLKLLFLKLIVRFPCLIPSMKWNIWNRILQKSPKSRKSSFQKHLSWMSITFMSMPQKAMTELSWKLRDQKIFSATVLLPLHWSLPLSMVNTQTHCHWNDRQKLLRQIYFYKVCSIPDKMLGFLLSSTHVWGFTVELLCAYL